MQVTITINGVNDIANVGDASVSVTEGNTASALNASGTLSIQDADLGENHVQARTGVLGTYGNFSIDTNGNWTYVGNGAHNELTAGQHVTDTFTVTSHIIVTFVLAFFIFIGVTIIGLVRHKLHFFSLFLPAGLPIYLAPLLIPIEIIGYLTRPISLSVRLAANMMAGHTMVEVFAGFIVALGIFGVAPFLFVTAVYGLEVVVAFLQAYVFAVLTCLYLSDAINLHKH